MPNFGALNVSSTASHSYPLNFEIDGVRSRPNRETLKELRDFLDEKLRELYFDEIPGGKKFTSSKTGNVVYIKTTDGRAVSLETGALYSSNVFARSALAYVLED